MYLHPDLPDIEIREIKNFLWTCDVEMVIYIEWTYCVDAAV